ncbi:MAG: c-type cytochrome [Ardenticatenaceae bacterium]|nr:c-type cytochrome [Anaerolineales bacterium]MCB8923599.1 c-type cytochrome [Ardenticatenaceae bacterium]MCB9003539.1 c-type cytochrome [Ardenticatenaceae bacterium]
MGWGRWLILLGIVLLLAACHRAVETAVPIPTAPPQQPADIIGDAERGERLYWQPILGSNGAPGCITCHSLAEGIILVGPSHYGLADYASDVVPEQTAEAYLWTSIVNPNAHLTDGFVADEMYGQYAANLTVQEIADLVAFMLTLHQ